MFLRLRRWIVRTCVASISLAALCVVAFAILSSLFPFPRERLDAWPVHPVVTDRSGRVLLERVGSDDQWRQPVPLARMSAWLPKAIVAAEDERFYSHPGVDPLSILRATWQNVSSGRKRSGASTLSMQVCRMIDDRPRTWSAKCVEAFRAIQLERLCTKDEILEAHLNLAPFGGNLRGVEAASRAWFGKSAADLSLAEAALLAGMPQAPSRHRPDRRPDQARARRSYVLRRMVEVGDITPEQAALAETEPLPRSLQTRSHAAPHAAALALQRRKQGGRTTIDFDLQQDLEQRVECFRDTLPKDADLAVVVLDVPTGEIIAMVGSADTDDPAHGQINGALAKRSPGSALKPFLYAAAFEARCLALDSLLVDEPIERDGWSPVNFDRTFIGEVTAAEALRRSLNVPAVRVTELAGLPRCLGMLEAAGIALPADAHRRGGLAVAVGALEVSLLDLVNGYATLARGGVRIRPRLFGDEPVETIRVMDANVCAALDDILSSHRRDPAGLETTAAESRPWFMWKTGTSSGRRDAWAVGHNRHYAAGVWVGRFSGQGDPEFVGREAAEPLLVEIFARSPLRRGDSTPRSWKPWVATEARPKLPRKGSTLRIISPAADEEFIALRGQSVVPVDASVPEGTQWFLNGRLLQGSQPARLELPAGAYDLRAVHSNAGTALVRFRVIAGE